MEIACSVASTFCLFARLAGVTFIGSGGSFGLGSLCDADFRLREIVGG